MAAKRRARSRVTGDLRADLTMRAATAAGWRLQEMVPLDERMSALLAAGLALGDELSPSEARASMYLLMQVLAPEVLDEAPPRSVRRAIKLAASPRATRSFATTVKRDMGL